MKYIKERLLYKNISDWTSTDFVQYFSHKLYNTVGIGLYIPKDGWMYYAGRVKNFRSNHDISAEDYKIFIDKVTEILFTRPKGVPAFGAIVSDKVYALFSDSISKKVYTNDDFVKLRDSLLSDKSLTFSLDKAVTDYAS